MFYLLASRSLQADELRYGIYNCDWYSAPIPFRKLVLNVLTRCTKDTIFEAYPWYVLDFELLKRVGLPLELSL